jgi:phosphoglycolate phosphatase
MASEISAFLCEGKGSGGGNIEMAGGFLAADEAYLFARIQEYLDRYDLIYAGKTPVDFEHAPRYRKLRNPVGFVKLGDIFQENWPVTIRTLEGDVDLKAKSNLYAMIGIVGEVYPIKKETFEKTYDVSDAPYELNAEYSPEVIDRISGDKISLVKRAQTCIPKGEKVVRAIQVSKPTKVFTEWDTEKYFSGAVGSFVVANEGQAGGRYDDCYVVAEQIFKDSYEAV